MPHFYGEKSTTQDTVTLSKDQFDKLVELLTPGYEMAKWYLGQMQTPQPQPPDPTPEPAPSADFEVPPSNEQP